MKFVHSSRCYKQPHTGFVFIEPLKNEEYLQTGDAIDETNVRVDVSQAVDRAITENPALKVAQQAEITRAQANNAIGEFLSEPRNGNSVFRPEPVAGFIGKAESAFWGNLRLDRAYTLWLNSKKPIWHFVDKVLDDTLEIYEQGPYTYSRIESSILNQTARPTLRAISRSASNANGTSLAAIKHNEAVSMQVIAAKKIEHQQFRTDQLPQFDTEESFTRFLKKYPGLGRQARIKWMHSQEEKQLAQAERQIQNDIDAARKNRQDTLQLIEARFDSYIANAHIKLKQSAQNKFRNFAAEILQNPENFINNPRSTIQGINWRTTFKCASAVDLLEALSLRYGDEIVQMASEVPRLEKDMEATLSNLDKRTANLQNILNGGVDFEAVQHQLNQLNIEPSDVEKDAQGLENQVSIIEVVFSIQNALQQVHQDLDLQADVYNGNPIRLTPEEKIALLVKYLQRHPQHLADMEDIGAKRLLSRYLLQQDVKTKEAFIAGGIDGENATPFSRRQMLNRAKSTLESGNLALNEVIPNLSDIMKQRDAAAPQQALQQLRTFVDNFNQLWQILGVPKDENGRLNFNEAGELWQKIPEAERQVIRNVAQFEPLVLDLSSNDRNSNHLVRGESADSPRTSKKLEANGIIELLEQERNLYELILDDLPPNEELYANSRDQYNQALEEIMRIARNDVTQPSTSKAATGEDKESPRVGAGAMQAIASQASVFRDQGLQFVSGIDLPAEIVERAQKELLTKLTAWDQAISRKEAFSFTIPSDQRSMYSQSITDFSSAIQHQLDDLGQAGIDAPQTPSLNDRMRRNLGEQMTERSEHSFAIQYQHNARQQWNVLQNMSLGHEVSNFQFGDLTHLGGVFNLSSGVTKRQNLGNLKLYRKDAHRILLESEGQDGLVIAITPPKDLKANFTPDQMEDESFAGHANTLIWKKSDLENGEDGLFRVPYTNYDKAGIMLNAGAGQAAKQTRAPKAAQKAQKRWHRIGYKKNT